LVQRLMINHVLIFGYVGFWHLALYGWNWGKRPFVVAREYSYARLAHNVWYTWLGTLQWTATEVAFILCFDTGKIFYPKTSVIEDPSLLIQTLLFSILLPNFRDVHFYFAHRLIHSKFLYQQVHCVHHRNTDVEPFSGLCMHPIEHLLYYTCYAPCLLGGMHPFILFWMGVHSVIAPAASHSGFEDHFSADLVHYLHHRFTNCNYGVPQSIPFDVWFGTFRGRADSAFKPTADPKARLGGKPDRFIFDLSWILLWLGVWTWHEYFSATVGAVLISIGPLLLALLSVWYSGPSSNHRSLIAPFDKDPLWSQVVHFGLGTLLGVLPATCLIRLVLL
jgi:sterol desaturase/sphingolipid hydroxylase (fatty acid hydroxylase superfamily)